jgi:hypothetical protein
MNAWILPESTESLHESGDARSNGVALEREPPDRIATIPFGIKAVRFFE